jgi:hypothetical protein
VNDFERVEKVYLKNWDGLFVAGTVRTAEPVVNWKQTRALLKNHFERMRPQEIIRAVSAGLGDDFVMRGGYSLGVILSASVLNRLINAGSECGPPYDPVPKKSLGGLET